MEEENKEVNIHSSGLHYYNIKLTNDDAEEYNLRLFESISSGRLKFQQDQETHDEYAVRKKYIKKIEKKRKGGTLVWNSSWGPKTIENALKVQAQIKNEQNIH